MSGECSAAPVPGPRRSPRDVPCRTYRAEDGPDAPPPAARSPPTDASPEDWPAVPSRAPDTSERTAVSVVPAFRPTAFLFYSTTPSTQPQRVPRARGRPPTRYVHRAIPGPVPPGSLRACLSHPPVRASHQPPIPFHRRYPVFRMDARSRRLARPVDVENEVSRYPGGTGQKFCAEVADHDSGPVLKRHGMRHPPAPG